MQAGVSAKILADPDRILLATGTGALVLKRTERGGEAPDTVSGENPLARPQNPIEKNSRHELSAAEEAVVRELKERDRDVRRHEQQHMLAAGELAKGNPRYHYQIGPDGKAYAVGGEVRIDTSPVAGDSEATRRKAERLRSAALAPGDASGPDIAVAGALNAKLAAPRASDAAASAYRRYGAAEPQAYELRLYA